MKDDYPQWICSPCGHTHGPERPLLASYRVGGPCGWCGAEDVPVTEPRDFGYPDAPWAVREIAAPKVRRPRGPGKKPAMRHVTIRIPQHVVDHYDGDLTAMRDAWVQYVEELINAQV